MLKTKFRFSKSEIAKQNQDLSEQAEAIYIIDHLKMCKTTMKKAFLELKKATILIATHDKKTLQ